MKPRNYSGTPKFKKFPVNFPVTRNFDSGDEFAVDCVHRHALVSVVFSVLG